MSTGWVSSVFVWHATALILASASLLVVCQVCARPGLPPALSRVPDTESGAQLVPCKLLPLRSPGPAIREAEVQSERSGPSVVDVEPWDNVTSQRHAANGYN